MVSIKNKILLVVLFVSILLSLFVFSTFYLFNQKIDTQREFTAKQFIHNKIQLCNNLDTSIQKHTDNKHILINSPILKNFITEHKNIDATKRLLLSIISTNNLLIELSIVDTKANEIIKVQKSANRVYVTEDRLNNISNSKFFNSIKTSKKACISKIEPLIINNKQMTPATPSIRVSIPIIIDGISSGYLISTLSLKEFFSHIATYKPISVYIFDSTGDSIVLPSSENIFAYHQKNIKEVFPTKYKNMMSNECDKESLSVRQVSLADHDYTIVFDKQYSNTQWYQNLTWYITAIFILLFIPLIYYILKSMAKDSQKLQDKIEYLQNTLTDSENRLHTLQNRFYTVEHIGNLGNFEYNLKRKSFWVSENFENIFCMDKESITKESIISLIHQADKRYVLNTLQNMIKNNQKELELKYTITANNENRVIVSKFELLFDEENNPYIIKGISEDITQKDKIEKELIEYKNLLEIKVEKALEKLRKNDDMLLAQSRLASHGELISMLAHQWRQPLSTISLTLANIQLLFRLNSFDKEQVQKEIENAIKNMDKLNAQIDDFRLFFQPTENMNSVDVSYIIQSSLNLVEPLIKSNDIDISLDIKCHKDIITYPNKLVQIILNILKNSIEQLIEAKILSPKIEVKCTIEDDKMLFIKISDNGGGVDDDIIFNVFDPYFSTKGKNGVGLGLFISKTIANRYMSGDIKVYNNSDGAIFLIELPIKE